MRQPRFSDDSIRSIRLRAATTETFTSIAKSYGVSAGMIGQIHRREVYKHVPDTDPREWARGAQERGVPIMKVAPAKPTPGEIRIGNWLKEGDIVRFVMGDGPHMVVISADEESAYVYFWDGLRIVDRPFPTSLLVRVTK